MWWKGICTWTTCIAIGLGSQHAMASVSGIVENFSGRGEFDSLHYPGWLRDEGVFEVGGGLRYNTSLDYDSVAFAITGEGSFKTIVQFSEVDMGNVGSQDPIDSAYSNIFLDQLARNGGWYTQVHKGWQNSEKYMVRFGGPERNVVDVVGSIRLENEYNAETHTGATRYVGGVDDPESIVVNTRQIDGGLVGNIVTQVMLNLTNEYGTEFDPPIEMNVLLDYILVLPLDAELGDFSGNGILDGEDVEMLKRASTLSVVEPFFDLNSDQIVDSKDLEHWVQVVKGTYFGDANLDGEFNSVDLVHLFQAGEYEDGIEGNSTWATGDWNADGEFSSADLVLAFQDGGYEQGPRESLASVPEPSGMLAAWIGAFTAVVAAHRQRYER
jgi:hypothetical protein